MDNDPRGQLLDRQIEQMLSQRSPGHTLPAWFYISPELFEREVREIFLKSWILTGHVSQLNEVGCFYKLELANNEILVVRTGAETVVAYFNVCRHRGCRLTDQAQGRVVSWVCPYHAWVYDLDGKLRYARGFESAQTSRLGLIQCALHVFDGFIFVNCGGASGMAEIATDVLPMFRKHQMDRCSVCYQESWMVDGNWKLLIENFDECYHCETIHPEYARVVAHAHAESSTAPEALNALRTYLTDWERAAQRSGSPIGLVETSPTQDHWAMRYPLKPGAQSLSINGDLVAPLLGSFSCSDGGVSSTRIYPASYIVAPCDYVIAFQFIPVSHARTNVRAMWLVKQDAPATSIEIERLTALWRITIAQDNRIVIEQQRGVSSAGYRSGPYAVTEEYCEHFNNWYVLKLEQSLHQQAENFPWKGQDGPSCVGIPDV